LTGHALAKAITWAGASNGVSQIAWFGSLIVLGALLPPQSFGSVAIGLVIANAAMLFQDAGSRGSIIVAKQLRAAEIRRTIILNVGAGLGLALALGLLAGPIINNFAAGGDPQVLRIIVLSVAVRALAIAPVAILQRTMRFKQIAIALAGSTLIAAIASIVAGALGAGVWALVIRQFVASALFAGFAWLLAYDILRLELRKRARGRGQVRRKSAPWFFLLATAYFVSLNIDYIIVGHARNARDLGLYSLAYMFAFAPLTQFTWQIGRVLFPAAAAAPDLETIRRRTLQIIRFCSLVLLPLLPPAIVLAPVIFPLVLGSEWNRMVLPFQILLIAGVGHGIVTPIGESLSGSGHIAFHARLFLAWSLAMAGALFVLVNADGIRGAAIAHLALFGPLAAGYVYWGGRRLGLETTRLARALRGIAIAVATQALTTALMTIGLRRLGLDATIASCSGAFGGVLVAAFLLWRSEASLLSELRTALGGALRKSSLSSEDPATA